MLLGGFWTLYRGGGSIFTNNFPFLMPIKVILFGGEGRVQGPTTQYAVSCDGLEKYCADAGTLFRAFPWHGYHQTTPDMGSEQPQQAFN